MTMKVVHLTIPLWVYSILHKLVLAMINVDACQILKHLDSFVQKI